MRNYIKKIIIAGCILFALAAGIVCGKTSTGIPAVAEAKAIKFMEDNVKVQEGSSKILVLEGMLYDKRKAKWSIKSGKQYIKLSHREQFRVEVTGKKTGVAKVQAKVGNKKYICKVTVTKFKYSNDEKNLLSLVKKVNANGGKIPEKLKDDAYTWEDRKLTRIFLEEGVFSESLKISGFNNLTAITIIGAKGLKTFNVKNCKNLEGLYCQESGLNKLTVSGCGKLTFLNCYSNNLSDLDVSSFTELKSLSCYENQLTKLDVNNCKKLESLMCANNKLESLVISNGEKLGELDCSNNSLTNLEIHNAGQLGTLNCKGNLLTSLNLDECINLGELDCSNNNLEVLDISKCINLDVTDVYYDEDSVKLIE